MFSENIYSKVINNFTYIFYSQKYLPNMNDCIAILKKEE